MLNELEIKVPYSVKNPHISDGLIKYLQQKLGRKIIKDQEPKSEFQLERERKKTFGESCDYIGKNGYLPQKLLGKRHAKINRHYKSLFKQDPPPIQKRRVIDPKLEKKIEEQFFEIYRKRQPLLENEYKSLEYMKNKLGFSMDKMSALPMQNDAADKAFEMLQKQEMLQKMLGTVDPFSITGIYELNNWERQRGNARRRRNIGDAGGGPGPDNGGAPGPGGGGGNQPLGGNDDDDGYIDPNEQTFQSLMGNLPIYPSLEGGNAMKDSLSIQPYGADQAKKGLFGIDIPHPTGGELNDASYYQQVHTRALIPYSMEQSIRSADQQQQQQQQDLSMGSSLSRRQIPSEQSQREQIDTSAQAQVQRMQQNAGFSLSNMVSSGVSKLKSMIQQQQQRSQQNQEIIQPKDNTIQNLIKEKQDPINDANNNALAAITNVNRGAIVEPQKNEQQSAQQAFSAIAQQTAIPLVAAQKLDNTIPFTDNNIAAKAAEQQMQESQQQQQDQQQQQQQQPQLKELKQEINSMGEQFQQQLQDKKQEEEQLKQLQLEYDKMKAQNDKQMSMVSQQRYLSANFDPSNFKQFSPEEISQGSFDFNILRLTNTLLGEESLKGILSASLTGESIEERIGLVLMDEGEFILKSNKGKQFLDFYTKFLNYQNQIDNDIKYATEEQKPLLQAQKQNSIKTMNGVYKSLITNPQFLQEAFDESIYSRSGYKFNIPQPIRSIEPPPQQQLPQVQEQPQPQPQVEEEKKQPLAIQEEEKQPVIEVSNEDSSISSKGKKKGKKTKMPAKTFQEEQQKDYDIKSTIKESIKLIDKYVTSSESDKDIDQLAVQIMKLSPNPKIQGLEKYSVKKVKEAMSNLRTTLTAFDNAFDKMTTADVEKGGWNDNMRLAVKAAAAQALQSGKPIGQLKKEIDEKGLYLLEFVQWMEGNAKTTPETYYQDLSDWIQNAFSEQNLGQGLSKEDILSATKALFKTAKKFEIVKSLNETGVQQKMLKNVPQEFYDVAVQDVENERRNSAGVTYREVFKKVEQDINSSQAQAEARYRKQQKKPAKKKGKKK